MKTPYIKDMTTNELIDLFNDAREKPEKYNLTHLDASGMDLSDLDLSDLDLSGMIAEGAILEGTKFKRSKLNNSNFITAYCEHTDFSGADLEDINLENAYIENTNFKETILAENPPKETNLMTERKSAESTIIPEESHSSGTISLDRQELIDAFYPKPSGLSPGRPDDMDKDPDELMNMAEQDYQKVDHHEGFDVSDEFNQAVSEAVSDEVIDDWDNEGDHCLSFEDHYNGLMTLPDSVFKERLGDLESPAVRALAEEIDNLKEDPEANNIMQNAINDGYSKFEQEKTGIQANDNELPPTSSPLPEYEQPVVQAESTILDKILKIIERVINIGLSALNLFVKIFSNSAQIKNVNFKREAKSTLSLDNALPQKPFINVSVPDASCSSPLNRVVDSPALNDNAKVEKISEVTDKHNQYSDNLKKDEKETVVRKVANNPRVTGIFNDDKNKSNLSKIEPTL